MDSPDSTIGIAESPVTLLPILTDISSLYVCCDLANHGSISPKPAVLASHLLSALLSNIMTKVTVLQLTNGGISGNTALANAASTATAQASPLTEVHKASLLMLAK